MATRKILGPVAEADLDTRSRYKVVEMGRDVLGLEPVGQNAFDDCSIANILTLGCLEDETDRNAI
jgi:hypothetical protein